ncbi:MAG: uridine diphosphate-N-acetylglucosamine-binding protein YvcK [Blastocatellales bacterium]
MAIPAPIRLVTLGGGTGLSTLLSGFRSRLRPPGNQFSLTAVVTVTDDGKSSGRLREEFGVLPPGDIRNCLTALAVPDEMMTRLFRYRFPGTGPLGGHSLGNLVLIALSQLTGNFLEGIEEAARLLNADARVLPSTLDKVDLVAVTEGRRTLRGQVAIKSYNEPIRNISLDPPDATALPEAVDAILSADVITIGPGSLFSSVIANLLVPGIREALTNTPATKIYICNAMTEFDETDGLTAVDHLRRLLDHAPGLKLDYAIFNSSPISDEMRERYALEKAIALEPPGEPPGDLAGIKFISLPLASEHLFVRHDPARLVDAIFKVYSA